MSPEQQSKLQMDQQFDELAYRTASICREIRRLRDDIARLANEERTQSRESQVADLISQVAELEAAQESVFPVIKTEILQLVDALGVKGNAHKELLLESKAKVRLNLHKFVLLDNAKNPGGAKFRGWLRTLIKREHVNAYRLADKGSVQKLNRRFSQEMADKHGVASTSIGVPVGKAIDELKSDKRRGVGRDEVPVRQLPEHFTEEEEQEIDALPDQCQALFLFSTGLWQQLSRAKQEHWADARPTDFELSRLTALARANRFVLRSVEEAIANNPIDWKVDHDRLFHELTRKRAHVVAQSLNRHFWKFMRIDTAWQFLFARLEPLDDQLTADIEATLEPDLMLAYLHTDVYMLCDTASRCFDWLDRCGLMIAIRQVDTQPRIHTAFFRQGTAHVFAPERWKKLVRHLRDEHVVADSTSGKLTHPARDVYKEVEDTEDPASKYWRAGIEFHTKHTWGFKEQDGSWRPLGEIPAWQEATR